MSLAIEEQTVEDKDKFDFKQNLNSRSNAPNNCKITDDTLLHSISEKIQFRMKTKNELKNDLESENIELNMIEETNEILKIAREVLRQQGQQRQQNNGIDQLLNKYLFQP